MNILLPFSSGGPRPPRLMQSSLCLMRRSTYIVLGAVLILSWWTISTGRASIPRLALQHQPVLEHSIHSFIPFPAGFSKPAGGIYTRTLVVGHLKSENVSWIHKALPELDKALYVVDDPTAQFHTPANKGREAMAYLT